MQSHIELLGILNCAPIFRLLEVEVPLIFCGTASFFGKHGWTLGWIYTLLLWNYDSLG